MGAQLYLERVGSLYHGACAAPGLCLPPPQPLPPSSLQLLLPAFSTSACTFSSAWGPRTPEVPQEALREEPGGC